MVRRLIRPPLRPLARLALRARTRFGATQCRAADRAAISIQTLTKVIPPHRAGQRRERELQIVRGRFIFYGYEYKLHALPRWYLFGKYRGRYLYKLHRRFNYCALVLSPNINVKESRKIFKCRQCYFSNSMFGLSCCELLRCWFDDVHALPCWVLFVDHRFSSIHVMKSGFLFSFRSYTTGTTLCRACGSGTSVANAGSTSCTTCAAGFFQVLNPKGCKHVDSRDHTRVQSGIYGVFELQWLSSWNLPFLYR